MLKLRSLQEKRDSYNEEVMNRMSHGHIPDTSNPKNKILGIFSSFYFETSHFQCHVKTHTHSITILWILFSTNYSYQKD